MDIYRDVARKHDWEPTADHFMVGMGVCIADDRQEAIEIMKSGQQFFFDVLGGGIRTAQRLVIQKTRYFEHEESRRNFPGLPSRVKQVPIEERVEKGLLLCGTPDAEDWCQVLHCHIYIGLSLSCPPRTKFGPGRRLTQRPQRNTEEHRGDTETFCFQTVGRAWRLSIFEASKTYEASL